MVSLTFAGVGSAFTIENYQSMMLLEVDDGSRLLIDCGSDARIALHNLGEGLGHKDIAGVYISHAHADHAGGLEWLGFYTYFDPTTDKIPLYANTRLTDQLWDHTLKGGMGSVQGKITVFDDFFETLPVEPNGHFYWGPCKLQLIETVHVMNGYEIVPSYGLMMSLRTPRVSGMMNTVFITTDTQFCPNQIMTFYQDADLIFQDCETAPYKSGVHAHFDELKTLPRDIKRKMWLYHYQDGDLPDAVSEGFRGFVIQGQTFDLEKIEE
jgi:ribonuclease BN (tRNA processing enzyme)